MGRGIKLMYNKRDQDTVRSRAERWKGRPCSFVAVCGISTSSTYATACTSARLTNVVENSLTHTQSTARKFLHILPKCDRSYVQKKKRKRKEIKNNKRESRLSFRLTVFYRRLASEGEKTTLALGSTQTFISPHVSWLAG